MKSLLLQKKLISQWETFTLSLNMQRAGKFNVLCRWNIGYNKNKKLSLVSNYEMFSSMPRTTVDKKWKRFRMVHFKKYHNFMHYWNHLLRFQGGRTSPQRGRRGSRCSCRKSCFNWRRGKRIRKCPSTSSSIFISIYILINKRVPSHHPLHCHLSIVWRVHHVGYYC